MKTIITLLILATIIISCNSETKRNEIIEDVTKISLENLESQALELNEKSVQVTGMVTHVCKHGGQKLFLTDPTQENNLLIRVSQSIPEFDVSLEGSTLEITGKVVAVISQPEEEQHDEEDCDAEKKIKDKAESEDFSTNISYHIEATSFKEVIVD